MPLNNVAAAEALLQLFNIDITWDELKKTASDQQALLDIKNTVKSIDMRRRGELFDSLPTIELLKKAKKAGISFRLSRDEVNPNQLRVAMIKNNQVIAESFGDKPPYVDFWKKLHLETYGTKHPSYDLKTLGEFVLNFISMYIAEHNEEKDKHSSHSNSISAFSVELSLEEHLGIVSISQSKLTLLSEILKNIFSQHGHSDIESNVEVVQISYPDYFAPKTGIFGIFTYEYETVKARLRISMGAPNAESLNRVDLHEALRTFRQEINNLPQNELNLSGNTADVIRTPITKENMKLGFTISSNEIENNTSRSGNSWW